MMVQFQLVHLEELLPYSYNWSGPNGFSSSLSSINSLVPGFYNLTVTDVYGCIYDEQFTINEPNCIIIIDTTYHSSTLS